MGTSSFEVFQGIRNTVIFIWCVLLYKAVFGIFDNCTEYYMKVEIESPRGL